MCPVDTSVRIDKPDNDPDKPAASDPPRFTTDLSEPSSLKIPSENVRLSSGNICLWGVPETRMLIVVIFPGHPLCLHLMSTSTSTSRSTVTTPLAPAAIGPYSQGILVDDRLYVSGQIAIDPDTGSMIDGSIEAETERVLENIEAILNAASMDFENVVRCEVFMTDVNNYGQVNEVYARYFNEQPPARQAVEVSALPRNAHVEISCIAVR